MTFCTYAQAHTFNPHEHSHTHQDKAVQRFYTTDCDMIIGTDSEKIKEALNIRDGTEKNIESELAGINQQIIYSNKSRRQENRNVTSIREAA